LLRKYITTFLDYTFLTTNNTKKFNTRINNLIEELESISTTTLELLNNRKALPIVIRNLINKFKYNHFLKNTFRKVVKSSRLENIGPKILVRDNTTR
jgi:c-di-AMP phosphodiesterase-like protein